MPSIAVVTPSLNQGRFIGRTVRSVLDQDHPASEYVVCDGGSSDDTLRVLEPYAGQLVLVSEQDRGQAHAVNKGILKTSSEVIGWLNSDDLYCAGALARVADCFDRWPEADVIYGNAELIGLDDAPLGPYYTEAWNPARLAERCYLCQPAVFFRRRVIRKFGLLDERLHFCMDYEFWLRLAIGGAVFKYVPTELAGSRLHPEAKTLRARAELHDELDAMLRERLGRVPDSWLLNHAHTLTELGRASGGRRLSPYALEVVVRTIALGVRWNGRVTPGLLRSAVAPILISARRRLT